MVNKTHVFVILLIAGIGIAAFSYLGGSRVSTRMYGDSVFDFYVSPNPLLATSLQLTGTYYMTEWEATTVHVAFYNSTGEVCASCNINIESSSMYVKDESGSTTVNLPCPGMYEVHLSSSRSEYIDVSITQSGIPGLMVGGALALIGILGIYILYRKSSGSPFIQSKETS